MTHPATHPPTHADGADAPDGGVWLRPIEPADYGPLRRYELSLTLGPRWRHRGTTPSPEAMVQSLWSGVLAQYLVQTSLRPEPVGLVTAYGADLQSGTVWVAGARFDDQLHPSAFVLGARRFIDHLFDTWPLRKLYAEVLEPNLAGVGRGAFDLFETEGVLREHAYVGGTYVHQHLLALRRATWETVRATRANLVGAGEQPGEVPSLATFLAGIEHLLVREPGTLDPDLPLVDQGLDSLDWLVLADSLEHLAPAATLVDGLEQHVTARSLHRWLCTDGVLRAAPGL